MVMTLKNRLVRLLSDQVIQTRHGALEYNAYLIKNLLQEMSKSDSTLTHEQKRVAITILYLNLTKLAKSADNYMEETADRHRLLN